MHLFADLSLAGRRLVARARWVYWVLVAASMAIVGALLFAQSRRLDAAAQEWGNPAPALVATADLAAGDPLAGGVRLAQLPAPVVPPAALTTLDALPAGAVAMQDIAAGEVVVAHDVVPSGAPAALIPAGWLGVPIPEQTGTAVHVGDRVAVAADGAVLAADGIVVAVDAETSVVVVAVSGDLAAAVADAAVARVAVVLVGGSPVTPA